MFLSLILMLFDDKNISTELAFLALPPPDVIIPFALNMFFQPPSECGLREQEPWPGNSRRVWWGKKGAFSYLSKAKISPSIKSYFQLLKICFSSLFISFFLPFREGVWKLFIRKRHNLPLNLFLFIHAGPGRPKGVKAVMVLWCEIKLEAIFGRNDIGVVGGRRRRWRHAAGKMLFM